MTFLTGTHLLLASLALAASACGSTPTPYAPTSTGSPDSGTSPPPAGDAGSAADVFVPFDAAGLIGDSSITNGGDAAGNGSGGVFDFGCGGGPDCPLTQVCCTKPGPPITFACVDPAACPGPDKIECDGPDECGPTAPVCCGVAIGNGSGTFPACNAAALGASCAAAADCVTFVGNCSQTSKLQVCHSGTDCTDPTNNKCCTFSGDGGAALSFCYDPTVASLAGGVCH